jgi:hypothetical protein
VLGICGDVPSCFTRFGDLTGDGTLLVADSWDGFDPYRCAFEPCQPKRNGSLWRIDGARATPIASSPRELTPLDVQGERILVDEGSGDLVLFAANGTRLQAFQIPGVDDAALAGGNVVALTPTALLVLDATTAAEQRRVAVEGSATLAGAAPGFAAWWSGRTVTVLRLADGNRSTFTMPAAITAARLTEAGLYVGWNGGELPFPGRVELIPPERYR